MSLILILIKFAESSLVGILFSSTWMKQSEDAYFQEYSFTVLNVHHETEFNIKVDGLLHCTMFDRYALKSNSAALLLN